MFSYQLKSAFRYFSKQKLFISINILGLIIAFAVSSLIMLYVINELKYDSQHKNRNRIYRVLTNRESIQTTDARTTLDIGPLIIERFPEVKKMSRLVINRASVLKQQQEEFTIKTVFVDPDFLEMFTLKSPQIITSNLLSAPDAVVISEKLAQLVYGNDYPVGRNLQISFPQGKEAFFKITGIVQNPGEFSSINGDLFMNFEYYEKNLCDAFLASYPFFTTFLMVPPGSDISLLEEKINEANRDDWTGIASNKYELQKYGRMYLHSADLSNSFFPTGNSKFLYGLIFLVTLVVTMACLNFAILSTACALKRNKEIGIRKINGATLNQVKRQIMFESFLQVVIALPLAIFAAQLLLPMFNHFVGRALVFNSSGNFVFIAGITFLSLLTATLAGLITASTSVKVSPVQLLRKETRKFEFSMNLTRFLLTSQMIVVIWFLALTFIIQKQIHFSTSKGLGYSPENLLVCNIFNPNYKSDLYNPQYENPAKLEDLKSKLSASSIVENISIVEEVPPLRDQLGSGVIIFPETQKSMPISVIACNAEFPEFMGYRLKDGGFFSKDYSGSHEKEIMLNEAAIKYLGMDNPVGQIVDMDGAKSVKIVGVVYDFNFQSMRKEIVPVRLQKTDKFLRRFDVVIQYRPEMGNEAMAHFKSIFNEMYQEYETEITFYEDKLNSLYEKEITESWIFKFGIALAVFIAMIGIFGISLFTVRQQVKEIGIRKINGAAVTDILSMLNLVIFKWVAIAFVIATPIAYYAMNKWLESFAYKTELSWWIFALAGLLAMGIALLTVSWQSWRAATRNPVEALRYE